MKFFKQFVSNSAIGLAVSGVFIYLSFSAGNYLIPQSTVLWKIIRGGGWIAADFLRHPHSFEARRHGPGRFKSPMQSSLFSSINLLTDVELCVPVP